jgi:hypothetical protein
MSPEDVAAAVNAVLTSTPIRLHPQSIKPRCCECDTPINPDAALMNDRVLVWTMPDGSNHSAGLCRRCIKSLDRADHAETIKRLQTIRAKAFS